jgi:hypothetical protein
VPLISCLSDPLISHGRHFGRTIHALCNVQALLTNGLLRLGELAEEPDESFTAECAHYSLLHLPFLILATDKDENTAYLGCSYK